MYSTAGEHMNRVARVATTLTLILTLVTSSAGCSAGGAASTVDASAGSPNGAMPGVGNGTGVTTVIQGVSVTWDRDDLHANWSTAGSTSIRLQGDEIEVDGRGAVVDGDTVTITAGGTYVISGVLDDGQVQVETVDVRTVQLVLNGADIVCSTSAPIYVVNAEKTVITLAEGSVNRVEDGAQYVFEDADTDEPNAAIFSHDDLTINGDGALTVVAHYDNGIQSKDDLKIAGGDISVEAVHDAVKGRDSVAVRGGVLRVTAGGDGIQASNDADAAEGFVLVEGGSLSIVAAMDGIQAETALVVSGGTLEISTGGGSATVSTAMGWSRPGSGGPAAQQVTADESESAKGLKAGTSLVITGGDIVIDSADDAVHSNGIVTIGGGKLTLASGDDGIHADASVEIADGAVDITASYEGIESAVIRVDGGEVHVVSRDDGVNVSGGNDGSGAMGWRPGQDSFSASSENYLEINGGYVVVDAMGDGLDINGSITMTGGTVIVNGPTSSGNGALDYYSGCEVSGGLLVAAGSIGMAQGPSASSAQNSVMVNLTSPAAAGAIFRIETADGEALLTFAPARAYQSFVFSSAELQNGATYIVYTGGASIGTAVDGLYSDGEYTGGTKFAEFTVSGAVTTVGTVARAFPGGPGGGRRTLPQA